MLPSLAEPAFHTDPKWFCKGGLEVVTHYITQAGEGHAFTVDTSGRAMTAIIHSYLDVFAPGCDLPLATKQMLSFPCMLARRTPDHEVKRGMLLNIDYIADRLPVSAAQSRAIVSRARTRLVSALTEQGVALASPAVPEAAVIAAVAARPAPGTTAVPCTHR